MEYPVLRPHDMAKANHIVLKLCGSVAGNVNFGQRPVRSYIYVMVSYGGEGDHHISDHKRSQRPEDRPTLIRPLQVQWDAKH